MKQVDTAHDPQISTSLGCLTHQGRGACVTTILCHHFDQSLLRLPNHCISQHWKNWRKGPLSSAHEPFGNLIFFHIFICNYIHTLLTPLQHLFLLYDYLTEEKTFENVSLLMNQETYYNSNCS